MKDNNNNANNINVIPNLFRNLKNTKILKRVQDDNVVVVQNDTINKTVKNLVPQCPSALMPLKKNAAFTLAETLITLGIIGIVTAITIPTLITAHQKKQTVVKLQRAISVINQAYKLSYDDVGEPSAQDSFEMGPEQYFKTYWAPYLKVLTYCSGYAVCGYKNNTPFTYANNQNVNVAIYNPDSRVSFLTADGFFYIVYTANYPNGEKTPYDHILLDINGGEGPNRMGRDVFWLVRTQDDGGGVQPLGYNRSQAIVSSDCNKNSTSEYPGGFCADYIRRSGWSINKDYPWEMKRNK